MSELIHLEIEPVSEQDRKHAQALEAGISEQIRQCGIPQRILDQVAHDCTAHQVRCRLTEDGGVR